MEHKNDDDFLEKLEEKNTNLTLTKIIIKKQDLFK